MAQKKSDFDATRTTAGLTPHRPAKQDSEPKALRGELNSPPVSSKTEHYRSYTVREHERKMYERVYKFVCIGCDRVVERKSYAVCCPSYGNECNGKTSICRRGK